MRAKEQADTHIPEATWCGTQPSGLLVHVTSSCVRATTENALAALCDRLVPCTSSTL